MGSSPHTAETRPPASLYLPSDKNTHSRTHTLTRARVHTNTHTNGTTASLCSRKVTKVTITTIVRTNCTQSHRHTDIPIPYRYAHTLVSCRYTHIPSLTHVHAHDRTVCAGVRVRIRTHARKHRPLHAHRRMRAYKSHIVRSMTIQFSCIGRRARIYRRRRVHVCVS